MSRERITITLKQSLLASVDKTIDGKEIRNRSHAIEYLLTKAMPSPVRKAVILVGGTGAKMRPFTYELPKTLLPVRNKPILEYILQKLKNTGIEDVAIITTKFLDKLTQAVGDGRKFGLKISYFTDEGLSGTGAPLARVKKFTRKEPFILWFGDVLSEINLRDLVEFYEERQPTIAMSVAESVERPHDWGLVSLKGERVVNFEDRPKKKKFGQSHLVNGGVYIVSPKIFNILPKKSHADLEKDVYPKLIKQGKLLGYIFSGKWFDVATPRIYGLALKYWTK